jgi:hypothetical protein
MILFLIWNVSAQAGLSAYFGRKVPLCQIVRGAHIGSFADCLFFTDFDFILRL